jgi:5-methylcytosine-specific restriction endonuclease McrA
MIFTAPHVLNVDPSTIHDIRSLVTVKNTKNLDADVADRIIRKHLNKVYHRTRAGEMQQWRCAICNIPTSFECKALFPTAEHIVPKSDGGADHYDNFLVTCYRCNNKRGTEDIFEFWNKTQK